MPRICVLGSLNVDHVVSLDRFHLPGETVAGRGYEVFLGGKGGNQAVAAARLGASVAMVGCVGRDAGAELYAARLREEGVDARDLSRVEGAPTGVALIEVDASGENRIAVVRGANRELSPELVEVARAAIEGCDALLIQLEIPFESSLRAAEIARAAGKLVILDPAPAPTEPLPDRLLAACDYVTPNERELAALTGSPVDTAARANAACKALLSMGAAAVLHKRGAKGATLAAAGRIRPIPAFRVRAADATAAGDTFNAAFAVGLLRGESAEGAARFANAAAALSVTAMGAQSAMPSLSQVERFIEAAERGVES